MLPNNAGNGFLIQLNERNKEAWEYYCCKFRPFIFNYILGRVNDRSLAEDLTQDCLIAFYGSVGQFKDETHIKRYLLRIAANKCVDHFKSSKNRKSVALNPDIVDEEPGLPGAQGEYEIFIQKVIELYKALPEPKRKLLHAMVIEGKKPAEYAAEHNMKAEVVRAKKYKILELLRLGLGLKLK